MINKCENVGFGYVLEVYKKVWWLELICVIIENGVILEVFDNWCSLLILYYWLKFCIVYFI